MKKYRKSYMKIFMATALLIAVSMLSGGIASAAEPLPVTVQTGYNWDWWEDTESNRAFQSFVPLKISTRWQDLSFSLLTGYADTHFDPSGGENVHMSHMLDTKLNTSYQITGKLPVDILIGLDFNLPTGKTNLENRELVLIMDPDLISINNFGEGFNVNPVIVMTKEWGDFVAGLGFGYLWRGEYDFSQDIKDFDPGDIYNMSAEVRYYFKPGWNARLFTNYIRYTKEQVEDKDFFQEGALVLGGIGVYTNQPKWGAGFTFKGIFRNKAKFQDADGDLSTEDKDIHGNEYRADLFFNYILSERVMLKSFLQGLLLTENDYPSSSPYFIGQRKKGTLGLGTVIGLTKHLDAELALKGFAMHDNGAEFPEHLTKRTYRGFSAAAFLTARF